MAHPDEDLLDLYYHQQLDAETYTNVAEHLNCCPGCRARVNSMAETLEEIREILAGR